LLAADANREEIGRICWISSQIEWLKNRMLKTTVQRVPPIGGSTRGASSLVRGEAGGLPRRILGRLSHAVPTAQEEREEEEGASEWASPSYWAKTQWALARETGLRVKTSGQNSG